MGCGSNLCKGFGQLLFIYSMNKILKDMSAVFNQQQHFMANLKKTLNYTSNVALKERRSFRCLSLPMPGTRINTNLRKSMVKVQVISTESVVFTYFWNMDKWRRYWRYEWQETGQKLGASQTLGPGCHICDPALQFQTHTTARGIKKPLLILANVLTSGRMCFCACTCVCLCGSQGGVAELEQVQCVYKPQGTNTH